MTKRMGDNEFNLNFGDFGKCPNAYMKSITDLYDEAKRAREAETGWEILLHAQREAFRKENVELKRKLSRVPAKIIMEIEQNKIVLHGEKEG